MSERDEGADERQPGDVSPRPDELVVSSADLFKGRREIVIEHDGEHYRLRITRKNRLVLVK